MSATDSDCVHDDVALQNHEHNESNTSAAAADGGNTYHRLYNFVGQHEKLVLGKVVSQKKIAFNAEAQTRGVRKKHGYRHFQPLPKLRATTK